MFVSSFQVNKSLITNLIAGLIILSSFWIANPEFANALNHIGFFALSGALTNWLAIYMLFERVPFIYGSGVIPNQFSQFKKGLKRLVMEEFFSDPSHSPLTELSKETLQQILGHINYDKIFDSLAEEIQNSPLGAMLSMMGGSEAINKFKPTIKEKIQTALHSLVDDFNDENVGGKLSQKVSDHFHNSIEKIVDKRLDQLTPEMVKEIIQKMIRAHLGWLVVWGGVIGGLLGLIKSMVVFV